MYAQRKLVYSSFLAAQVKDTDLRVGHTATMSRFGIWLVFTVSIAGRNKKKTNKIFIS